MKPNAAAAFLLMALLTPLAAAAADADGDGVEDPPASTTPPAEEKPGGSQFGDVQQAIDAEKAQKEGAYGSFALDANGNKVTGDALSKLPPEARWAMETKGYSPVLGPNGEVLGYDNGMMCILPDAVGKDYALAAKENMLGPGVAGPCPPNFPACHSPEAAQPPPLVNASANTQDMMAGLNLGGNKADGSLGAANEPGAGQNFCDANPGRPPCAPVENPEEKADKERAAADAKVAAATESGNVDDLTKALDDRRNLAESGNKGRGGFTPMGAPGTDLASNDPGSGPIGSSGGQNFGQEGRVGGASKSGGGLDGREVNPDSRALAQSLIDMNRGMANGPLEGDSDPNVQSVAQVANRGLGGRAMDAARSLFSTLSENLGVAADAPETDLTDQLATNPIDGAAANRAPIKVVECKNDTLNGTAGGRTSRKIGGC
jgi:hypothetical protein